MAIYAIGDVQGCFAELQALLVEIAFNPKKDTLWFTGDLVNRGPASLEVLRFVKSLDKRQVTVLGNHDLHLLAVAYDVARIHRGDTLNAILTAPDKKELLDWLRERPLLHVEQSYVLVHAGLAPMWTLADAIDLAREVETVLRSDMPQLLLKHMYGDKPDYWQPDLVGNERWRCIVSYFTRMRFCHRNGQLDLAYKGELINKPANLIPWFAVPGRVNANEKIIFGHWAALGGKTETPNTFALDTGCVWGKTLTAMRLEDNKRFSVRSGNGI